MHSLIPFSPVQQKISLQAELTLISPHRLQFHFELIDPLSKVLKAPRELAEISTLRAHELWRETCFESFFSPPGSLGYWELNVAADGRWNIYEFTSYRQPQPPAESDRFRLADFSVKNGGLFAIVESAEMITALDYSLCAVVKTAEETFYYSNHHAGVKPDFHLRESFLLSKGIL